MPRNPADRPATEPPAPGTYRWTFPKDSVIFNNDGSVTVLAEAAQGAAPQPTTETRTPERRAEEGAGMLTGEATGGTDASRRVQPHKSEETGGTRTALRDAGSTGPFAMTEHTYRHIPCEHCSGGAAPRAEGLPSVEALAEALKAEGFVRGVAARYGRLNDPYWEQSAEAILSRLSRPSDERVPHE